MEHKELKFFELSYIKLTLFFLKCFAALIPTVAGAFIGYVFLLIIASAIVQLLGK